ncbi:CheR family methyltransferase [Nocardia otitidiscaviarum]|uniref:CheR family methyltransferase n=1 Tax=Nocardia otitidiscaviarum TaxID=1823 RepID=UPI001896299A|nr:CheR family methyltransferase [Nocardia otitidiscaviarum]MBF6178512.1 PAS domain-containing protein [Nocardia otitidiscaviarum]
MSGALEELLAFLRESRGFDVDRYRRSALVRRIDTRLRAVGVEDYADYRDMLESSAEEFTRLFDAVLGKATSCFRDPRAWQYLRSDVIPELLAAREPGEELRVWSAGCSSGQEAYSLAIAFAEAIGIEQCVERVKIYGTDVDEAALLAARAGTYGGRALASLSTDLRERYFDRSGADYVFRPDLRRRVIFGRHDITRDAPISRLDLLVCRNVLLYFPAETQSQILDRFSFAVRAGGYLFLGKAESLRADDHRFEPVQVRHQMYRRRPDDTVSVLAAITPRLGTVPPEQEQAERRARFSALALEYAPFPALAVDAAGVIVVANGRMRERFDIDRVEGRPLNELEIAYRPADLQPLIERAVSERHAVRVAVTGTDLGTATPRYWEVRVEPLWADDGSTLGVLVTFTDTTRTARLGHDLEDKQAELERISYELRSTNEELETTNEELQSSIEELETTNEELRSTNEELETINEELQSGNEELETMNEELRVRTAELDEARKFLEGVLASVEAGIVVLDSKLRIHSWNRGAERLCGLRADEVYQRPFADLDCGLPVSRLRGTIESCLESASSSGPIELEATDPLGRPIVCTVSCTPLNGSLDGLVLLMEAV